MSKSGASPHNSLPWNDMTDIMTPNGQPAAECPVPALPSTPHNCPNATSMTKRSVPAGHFSGTIGKTEGEEAKLAPVEVTEKDFPGTASGNVRDPPIQLNMLPAVPQAGMHNNHLQVDDSPGTHSFLSICYPGSLCTTAFLEELLWLPSLTFNIRFLPDYQSDFPHMHAKVRSEKPASPSDNDQTTAQQSVIPLHCAAHASGAAALVSCARRPMVIVLSHGPPIVNRMPTVNKKALREVDETSTDHARPQQPRFTLSSSLRSTGPRTLDWTSKTSGAQQTRDGRGRPTASVEIKINMFVSIRDGGSRNVPIPENTHHKVNPQIYVDKIRVRVCHDGIRSSMASGSFTGCNSICDNAQISARFRASATAHSTPVESFPSPLLRGLSLHRCQAHPQSTTALSPFGPTISSPLITSHQALWSTHGPIPRGLAVAQNQPLANTPSSKTAAPLPPPMKCTKPTAQAMHPWPHSVEALLRQPEEEFIDICCCLR
ncbi:hypothetical protein M747DRAFT_312436 [Aspergillus niger ATCC 13496]|uniref:Uncharacterized protein n=1 Tax=Aspergillus niger ATCC 13496 TaxID=1353008 RepID=A0A370CEN4_ASPNG|nr:hypothetical protein M747DRAFT_312436 [Aspergillus niger ATCC 13496]